METFKDIKGYEGLYQVSNLGNVKSLDRLVFGHKKCSRMIKGAVLNPEVTRNGYHRVKLCINGVGSRYTVHQLVAIAFLGHIINGHKTVVDHIDNDKANNIVDNLQLITNRHNCSKDIKNKTSKYTGVSYNKRYKNKWVAQIQVNGKKVDIGRFTTESEASEAYQKSLQEIQYLAKTK